MTPETPPSVALEFLPFAGIDNATLEHALDAICDLFERHVTELLDKEGELELEQCILDGLDRVDGLSASPPSFAFEFPFVHAELDPVATTMGFRMYQTVLANHRDEIARLVETFGLSLAPL